MTVLDLLLLLLLLQLLLLLLLLLPPQITTTTAIYNKLFASDEYYPSWDILMVRAGAAIFYRSMDWFNFAAILQFLVCVYGTPRYQPHSVITQMCTLQREHHQMLDDVYPAFVLL